MVLWCEVAREVPADFPDVTWDGMLVGAMTNMNRRTEARD
jgi:tartrate dehydrogenase/decarboxylase/D-malate dehydrogenase